MLIQIGTSNTRIQTPVHIEVLILNIIGFMVINIICIIYFLNEKRGKANKEIGKLVHTWSIIKRKWKIYTRNRINSLSAIEEMITLYRPKTCVSRSVHTGKTAFRVTREIAEKKGIAIHFHLFLVFSLNNKKTCSHMRKKTGRFILFHSIFFSSVNRLWDTFNTLDINFAVMSSNNISHFRCGKTSITNNEIKCLTFLDLNERKI